jgi:NAD-dependent SIR2 family protein deacetylase
MKKLESFTVHHIELSDNDERDDFDDVELCKSHGEVKNLHCEDCDKKICTKDPKHKGHEIIT